ncbi:glyoxalase/bleomycin resistance/extradiol dioxygenase family protein [Xanthobacter sp. V4C-4]|uniref:VOC family protein n=1 Tax=Xanthobacter cornucopiae TaxID=3119924 RepID=UPI00372C03CA
MAEAPGTVVPYLTVNGAAEAIAFYQQVFGARETYRLPADDGRRLLHARLTLGTGLLMLSDDFPEYCTGGGAPASGGVASVAVSLSLATAAEVDATHAAAVAAGAISETSPQDVFWGDRFATVRDPFGHRWMLTAPKG